MKNITDYKVLHEPSAEAMTVAVMANIKDGWQPLGPPGTHGGHTELSQALVKYERKLAWWEAEPGKGTNSLGPG